MVERTDLSPPRALIDLARHATTGDVSPRRHQASRALLLERSLTPRSRAGRWALVAIALAGTGAGGFAFAKARFGHSVVPEEQLAADELPGPVDPPQPPPPLTIEVAPEQAKIYWDDELLEGNPATVTRPPDGKAHRVKAQATGYRTKTETVFFTAPNTSVSFHLEALPVEIGPIMTSAPIRDAEATIEPRRQSFRDCYESGLEGNPSMSGRATIMLTVAEDGRVTASQVTENSSLSTDVATCLAEVAGEVHFPSPAKKVQVRIPIAFRDSDPLNSARHGK